MRKKGATMKRTFLAIVTVFIGLALAGCGGDGIVISCSNPPTTVTQILSDPAFDGDIMQNFNTNEFTITQGDSQSVFAGIDPATGDEYRAFLVFPLTGPAGVPSNAVIVSASLDIVISNISPQPLINRIPIRIDLVYVQPPRLVGTDFDRTLQPALITTTIVPPISQADFGSHVTIDVTSLMTEAQRFGLADFQVRILEDLGMVSPGIIEIDDTTGSNRGFLAPLLTVEYF
jgi:hypothetical protein